MRIVMQMNERLSTYTLLLCLQIIQSLATREDNMKLMVLVSIKEGLNESSANETLEIWRNVSFPLDDALVKRDSWASPFSRKREQELDQISMQLKSYISSASFDVEGFMAERYSLSEQLAKTGTLLENLLSSSKTLQRYLFLNRMFDVFSDTAEKLMRYSKIDVPGNRLLYKVVEIKARALALYNTNGAPELKTDSFDGKVLALAKELYAWERRINGLVDVPTDVLRDFKEQFTAAENMILVLRSYSYKNMQARVEEVE